eukprot:961806_1
MWIQTALSSLLLVLSRASVDCKAVEIETAGLSVLYPMDSCTTTTTIANGESIYSGLVYWCDGSDPVVSAYNQANCGGSALSTTKLSDANAGATITAYCDKSACEVITFGTVIKSTCAGQATMVSEVAWISDYCFSTYGSVSTKYTCSGDDVIISTYASSDCTGTSSDMSYANTGLEECSELQGIATATQVTCGMASFHTEATTETPETCTKGVNYAIDGAICHVWGDPHFNTWSGVRGRHDFMGQPATGKSQFYYVARCNGATVDDMPFTIIGKHKQWSGSGVTGLQYVTMELYDDDGSEYIVFLSSSIARYGSRGASTLYDEQGQLAYLTSGVDTTIGNRFSIQITRSSSRMNAVLTIDGTCTVQFWMDGSMTGMHTLYITPPDCYRCFICGLCGDFRRAAAATSRQKLETCGGGFVEYTKGWGSDNAFAYDTNGNTWEVNYCSQTRRRLSGTSGEYTPDIGDFTYVEPCDSSIEQQVAESCQTARDNAVTCCDLIGGTLCDELQESCEFDVCVVAGTDTSVIDETVAMLFTAAVDLACEIPNIAYLFDEDRVIADTVIAEFEFPTATSTSEADLNIGIYIGAAVAVVLVIACAVYMCRKIQDKSARTVVPSSTQIIQMTSPSVDALPTDWVELHTSDGRIYYQNNITKETRWDKPIAAPPTSVERPPGTAIASDIVPHKSIYPVLPNRASNPQSNESSAQLNEEDPLPSGWVKLFTKDNRVYYQNNVTKETQWTMPSTMTESKDNGTSTADGTNTFVQIVIAPSAPEDMIQIEEEGVCGNPAMDTSGFIDNDKGNGSVLSDDKCFDVKQFFEGVHVLQEDKVKYFKLFIVNGFDALEIVKTISYQDLLDIGVSKLSHRKIILSKAQSLDNDKDDTPPECDAQHDHAQQERMNSNTSQHGCGIELKYQIEMEEHDDNTDEERSNNEHEIGLKKDVSSSNNIQSTNDVSAQLNQDGLTTNDDTEHELEVSLTIDSDHELMEFRHEIQREEMNSIATHDNNADNECNENTSESIEALPKAINNELELETEETSLKHDPFELEQIDATMNGESGLDEEAISNNFTDNQQNANGLSKAQYL